MLGFFKYKKLETTDNNLVELAVGKENRLWYVQTTDKQCDTYLSEGIIEGLDTKEKAMKVAKKYAKKYGMDIQEW